nr:phosphotransferase [Deltaproteobacteria bacterium]
RQYDCCRIEPESVKRELDHDAKQIIETIFMFNSTVRLKPLSGGFSGGMLFWVEGRKKGAKSEPEVLKIDTHEKMHREIQGYNLVKALLGKTIPSFSQPVFHGKYTGIKMELAAMEGEPDTLQSKFEKIQQIKEFEIFLDPYESIIKKLQTSVYENTTHTTKIYPYKAFGLHTDQQKIWLGENISHILPEADLQSDTFQLSSKVFVKNCISGFDIITKHMDRLNTETSLCHGDLNFANIIYDIKKNVWVIDWAYADEMPIEIDFAKMENDIKFVMSKSITEDDLDDLLKLETSMLSSIQLPDIEKLPPALDIFRKDIRYQKIYAAVRLLRDSYLSIKRHQNHILYKISLLKNAAHTLSFDKRRGRGECSLGQLKYALLSTCLLVESIIRDPLHQEIRKESPDEYPQRIPVPKDLASWDFPFPEYDPEYYVDQVVIANDCTRNLKGWADPEALSDAQGLRERRCSTGKLRFDASGKPLNPKGRTGIQGRGLLGKWGPNYAVDPVLTRINPVNGDLEVVLVKRADTGEWGLPGAIMVEDESFMQSAKRALEVKTKIDFDFSRATLLGQMYIDDYRNTDNAWMESYAVHLHLSPKEIKTIKLKEGLGIQDAAWVSITPEVVNRLFANHSEIIKMVLEKLLESGEPVVDHSAVKNILLNI